MKWHIENLQLSKHQTSYIKGVGILFIVLHNFLHWVAPNPGENEFDFSITRGERLVNQIIETPTEIINILFSYFGHFGVQLFILISGYGLALSYLKFQGSSFQYIKSRISKIYPTFLIGIFVLLVYLAYTRGGYPDVTWWTQISYKLLMINNWLPDEALTINGPWWFYSLIFQLYILFPLVYYVVKQWKIHGLVIVSIIAYLLIFITYRPLLDSKLYIMANAPGHLPEFALGIFLAINPKIRIPLSVVFLSLAVFIWGNFHFSGYPFTFLALSLLMYSLFQWLFQRHKSSLSENNTYVYYGNISMYLFAIHGFFRPQVIGLIGGGPWWIKLFYALIFLLIVTGVALMAKSLHNFVNNTIISIRNNLGNFFERKRISGFVEKYRLKDSLSLLTKFFSITVFSIVVIRLLMMLWTTIEGSASSADFLHLYYGTLRDVLVCSRWFVLLIIPTFLLVALNKFGATLFLYLTTLPLVVLSGYLSYYYLSVQTPCVNTLLYSVKVVSGNHQQTFEILSLWGFIFIGSGIVCFFVGNRIKFVSTFTSALVLLSIIVAGFTPKPMYINPPKSKFKSEKLYFQALNYPVYFAESVIRNQTQTQLSEDYKAALLKFRNDFPEFESTDVNYPFYRQMETRNNLADYFKQPSKQPNFVFVVVGGYGSLHSGPNAKGLSVTPFLDSLANNSLYWPNCFSTSINTSQTLPSIFSSVPFGNGFTLLRNDMPNHMSFLGIANDLGYTNSFFYGGDLESDGILHYLSLNKTKTPIVNRDPNVMNKPNGTSTFLGWNDLELVQQRFSYLSLTDIPFVDVYYTISSRYPEFYEEKEKWKSLFRNHISKNQLKGSEVFDFEKNINSFASLFYTDNALRELINSYKKNPEYKNTIFIITGDNLNEQIQSTSILDKYRVPLIIYSECLKKPEVFLNMVSHLDIVPTILAYMKATSDQKIPLQSHWFGSGLEFTTHFKATKRMAIFDTANKIRGYLHDSILISDDIVYQIKDNLQLKRVESDNEKDLMNERIKTFNTLNNYVISRNALMPSNVTKRPRIVASLRDTYIDFESKTIPHFFNDNEIVSTNAIFGNKSAITTPDRLYGSLVSNYLFVDNFQSVDVALRFAVKLPANLKDLFPSVVVALHDNDKSISYDRFLLEPNDLIDENGVLYFDKVITIPANFETKNKLLKTYLYNSNNQQIIYDNISFKIIGHE